MAGIIADQYGLGDPLMLEKIDKLFVCGVGEHVYLPQIVVVGDQSSGKSSILEGLVRMALPRDSGLCTRFATQIIFRRSNDECISVSIIPDVHASAEHKADVEGYSKNDIKVLDSDTFVKIMKEVHEAMGVAQVGEVNNQKQTFSNDVLRLEITGPNQQHFSVIDVPGIFRNTEEGVTKKDDIRLVREMTSAYMENPRSVMLAVVPANTDVATQDILELARDVDPEGDRTLGVLTKPDLVDDGGERRVLDIIEGRTKVMKLGWHVVRNPGQKDLMDPAFDRYASERSFFKKQAPWKSISKDSVGVESLRARLKDVLGGLVKQEFPKVKQEIMKKLTHAEKAFKSLGPDRHTPSKQAAYLTELSSQYERLVMLSLQAQYGSDELFDTKESLRLAPAVASRSAIFNDEMERLGHSYSFHSAQEEDVTDDTLAGLFGGENPFKTKTFATRKEKDPGDIANILHPSENLNSPSQDNINPWLRKVYESSRGFELGTFDSSILAATMKKQATKWASISLGYVSDIIVLIHKFITTAISSICYDVKMKDALFGLLSEGLLATYTKAMENVDYLLTIELSGKPLTLNHYFNENLEKCRQARMVDAMKKVAFHDNKHGTIVRIGDVKHTHSMSNTDHVVQDIHDILSSYYKVARKRFVDNVIKQATDHFLVNGPQTPLKLFSSIFVSKLSPEELEHIAGEAPRMKRERARVTKEIASLTEAKAILLRS